jgi:hypothetical protein
LRRWLRWYLQSTPSFKHPGCLIRVDETHAFISDSLMNNNRIKELLSV